MSGINTMATSEKITAAVSTNKTPASPPPAGQDEAFWRQRLQGLHTPTSLALSPSGEAVSHPEKAGAENPATLDLHHASAAIDSFLREHRLGLDTLLIAVWARVLRSYSNETKVLFGVRFDSPAAADHLWPVSIVVKDEIAVIEWLQIVAQDLAVLRERSSISLRDLHLWCEVPVEQTLLESVLDFSAAADRSPGRVASAPILLQVTAQTLRLAYRAGTFSRNPMRRLLAQVEQVISEMISAPNRKVGELEILPRSEREQLLSCWNSTRREYPPVAGLHELVERQVAATPDAIAVISPDGQAELTYAELNRRANQLAHRLQKSGVKPDVVVGICAERSIEMAVAVLAVIKAGGAYVPLDPNYPRERLLFMLEDTHAPVLLTQKKLLPNLPPQDKPVICLDTEWESIGGESGENPAVSVAPEDLAYLIYTSGSTGKPKGVAMRQSPVINLLNWQLENWSARRDARTLQFASLNFDVSFQEIFSTWVSGGTLVLIGEETRRDANALVEYLERHRLERLFLPFVALKHLADAADRLNVFPSSLREVITAGEQLQITPQIARFFTQLPHATLENQYGPSETHVVTAFRLTGPPAQWPALPSIGRPIANAEMFILDQRLRPVPIGVSGELFLGGDCLARGYLNRPDLTAEKFLPHPFGRAVPGDARVYKTGDLARYLEDGNIEFLGRIDHQVKVRGFRIELGEIEAVLSKHPLVQETVVVARDGEGGDKQLVAYLVARPGEKPLAADLRRFLKERLPSYFVPAFFVTLPSLPLTPNGKVDRRALPEPNSTVEEMPSTVKMPATPLEMQLKLVFEKFFSRRPIGIDMSFFELGGDSLQALRLIVEIERATGKRLPLGILYQASTVEELGHAITSSGEVEWSALVPLQPNGTRVPLFLVHTTPGDVLGYGNLIYHMSGDQPCYGFQSLGLRDEKDCHTRIDEMAAYYVKLLREVQSQGPYYLAGWCYGGIVAVEMAHQLSAAGQEIGFLGLIETPAPPPEKGKAGYYARRFARLLGRHPRQWKIYLREKIRYYRGVKIANEMRFKRVDEVNGKPVEAVEEHNRYLEKLEYVYHVNLDAVGIYRSKRYSGRVVLFNAAQQDPAIIPDPFYGWRGLAEKIDIHVIPGDHDTILMEPNVRDLARKLSAYLPAPKPSTHVLQPV